MAEEDRFEKAARLAADYTHRVQPPTQAAWEKEQIERIKRGEKPLPLPPEKLDTETVLNNAELAQYGYRTARPSTPSAVEGHPSLSRRQPPKWVWPVLLAVLLALGGYVAANSGSGMFDLTDHQLSTIGTWAEVAILLWMVGERFAPRLGFGSMIAQASQIRPPTGLLGFFRENKTVIFAAIGLVIVTWLHFREVPVPTVTGFTQLQVDEKVAAATAPLQKQLDEANKDLKNTRDIIVGLQGELVDRTHQRDAALSRQSSPPPAAAQPPQSDLSAEDIATKISIWDSVLGGNLNRLITAYNDLDLMMSKWLDLVKTDDGRRELLHELAANGAAYSSASDDLERLRDKYPNYQDVAQALSQPHRAGLEKAINDFYNAVAKIIGNPPPNFEVELRPVAGALRREMDLTVGWFGGIRNIAKRNREELGNK